MCEELDKKSLGGTMSLVPNSVIITGKSLSITWTLQPKDSLTYTGLKTKS